MRHSRAPHHRAAPLTLEARVPDYNVTGTSSGAEKQVVVDIECSAACQNITANGTQLAPPSGAPSYVCKNIASTAQVSSGT